ncbi:MAG: rRNA pseudouridine synthase [Lachnospiraceae bacterium]|nr:rRNA pseudouridine synthase [Lachnospiraceae bacterium]
MNRIRLDKYLANTTGESRTKVKEMIKSGRVKVNGVTASGAEDKIDSDSDEVTLDSKPVVFEKYRYFMFNKPAGCVSATRDKLSDTVLDFLKAENTAELFPVGRLDKDSEGLLLITNDGALAHELLSPKAHVDKVYFVKLDKELKDEDRAKIEDCIDIGDEKPCLPAKVIIKDEKEAFITINEGRFHQVKRMFAAVGYEVLYLKRISMGTLKLDDGLKPGEYRKLSEEEIVNLRKRGR